MASQPCPTFRFDNRGLLYFTHETSRLAAGDCCTLYTNRTIALLMARLATPISFSSANPNAN